VGHDRCRSWEVGERRPAVAAGSGRAEAAAGFCWRPAPTGSRWLAASGEQWPVASGERRPAGGEQRPAVCGWCRRRPQTLGPGTLGRRDVRAWCLAKPAKSHTEIYRPTGPTSSDPNRQVPSEQRQTTTLTACSKIPNTSTKDGNDNLESFDWP
jgi:hypothetical protein